MARRGEAMCQQLLAYSLTATTPKATEIAAPLGYLSSFSPISAFILRSFIHAAWGAGPGGAVKGGEGGGGGGGWEQEQVQRSEKMQSKSIKKWQWSVAVLPRSLFSCRPSPLTPDSAFIQTHGAAVQEFQPECVFVLHSIDCAQEHTCSERAVRALKD